MKKFGILALLISFAWFGYNLYHTYLKLDEETARVERSYVNASGGYIENYSFKNLSVLSMTGLKYSSGEWIVADESSVEKVTIFAQYSDLEKALKEIEASRLFVEDLIVDETLSNITFSVRVRGLPGWTLPF